MLLSGSNGTDKSHLLNFLGFAISLRGRHVRDAKAHVFDKQINICCKVQHSSVFSSLRRNLLSSAFILLTFVQRTTFVNSMIKIESNSVKGRFYQSPLNAG